MCTEHKFEIQNRVFSTKCRNCTAFWSSHVLRVYDGDAPIRFENIGRDNPVDQQVESHKGFFFFDLLTPFPLPPCAPPPTGHWNVVSTKDVFYEPIFWMYPRGSPLVSVKRRK